MYFASCVLWGTCGKPCPLTATRPHDPVTFSGLHLAPPGGTSPFHAGGSLVPSRCWAGRVPREPLEVSVNHSGHEGWERPRDSCVRASGYCAVSDYSNLRSNLESLRTTVPVHFPHGLACSPGWGLRPPRARALTAGAQPPCSRRGPAPGPAARHVGPLTLPPPLSAGLSGTVLLHIMQVLPRPARGSERVPTRLRVRGNALLPPSPELLQSLRTTVGSWDRVS